MTIDNDPPASRLSQRAQSAANAPEFEVIEGDVKKEGTVVDVITGKIHDLPDHYLLPAPKKD